jgi:hypothetical protein
MDKHEWQSFLRWLDQANMEELQRRRDQFRELLPKLTEPDTRSDARRCLRLIEQEMLPRSKQS